MLFLKGKAAVGRRAIHHRPKGRCFPRTSGKIILIGWGLWAVGLMGSLGLVVGGMAYSPAAAVAGSVYVVGGVLFGGGLLVMIALSAAHEARAYWSTRLHASN